MERRKSLTHGRLVMSNESIEVYLNGRTSKVASEELSFDERVLLMESKVIKVIEKEAENYFFLRLQL